MSILCVRAGCKILFASYSSKHTWQSLSDKPFVHTHVLTVCTHNLKTKGHIWTFRISNDCSIIKDISCLSCMRDPTGKLRPQTHIDQSLTQNCVRTLKAHTYIAIWCATTHDNKTHVHMYLMTAYYTLNNSFTANDA